MKIFIFFYAIIIKRHAEIIFFQSHKIGKYYSTLLSEFLVKTRKNNPDSKTTCIIKLQKKPHQELDEWSALK